MSTLHFDLRSICKRYTWQAQPSHIDLKLSCPRCGTSVLPTYQKCPRCNHPLDIDPCQFCRQCRKK